MVSDLTKSVCAAFCNPISFENGSFKIDDKLSTSEIVQRLKKKNESINKFIFSLGSGNKYLKVVNGNNKKLIYLKNDGKFFAEDMISIFNKKLKHFIHHFNKIKDNDISHDNKSNNNTKNVNNNCSCSSLIPLVRYFPYYYNIIYSIACYVELRSSSNEKIYLNDIADYLNNPKIFNKNNINYFNYLINNCCGGMKNFLSQSTNNDLFIISVNNEVKMNDNCTFLNNTQNNNNNNSNNNNNNNNNQDSVIQQIQIDVFFYMLHKAKKYNEITLDELRKIIKKYNINMSEKDIIDKALNLNLKYFTKNNNKYIVNMEKNILLFGDNDRKDKKMKKYSFGKSFVSQCIWLHPYYEKCFIIIMDYLKMRKITNSKDVSVDSLYNWLIHHYAWNEHEKKEVIKLFIKCKGFIRFLNFEINAKYFRVKTRNNVDFITLQKDNFFNLSNLKTLYKKYGLNEDLEIKGNKVNEKTNSICLNYSYLTFINIPTLNSTNEIKIFTLLYMACKTNDIPDIYFNIHNLLAQLDKYKIPIKKHQYEYLKTIIMNEKQINTQTIDFINYPNKNVELTLFNIYDSKNQQFNTQNSNDISRKVEESNKIKKCEKMTSKDDENNKNKIKDGDKSNKAKDNGDDKNKAKDNGNIKNKIKDNGNDKNKVKDNGNDKNKAKDNGNDKNKAKDNGNDKNKININNKTKDNKSKNSNMNQNNINNSTTSKKNNSSANDNSSEVSSTISKGSSIANKGNREKNYKIDNNINTKDNNNSLNKDSVFNFMSKKISHNIINTKNYKLHPSDIIIDSIINVILICSINILSIDIFPISSVVDIINEYIRLFPKDLYKNSRTLSLFSINKEFIKNYITQGENNKKLYSLIRIKKKDYIGFSYVNQKEIFYTDEIIKNIFTKSNTSMFFKAIELLIRSMNDPVILKKSVHFIRLNNYIQYFPFYESVINSILKLVIDNDKVNVISLNDMVVRCYKEKFNKKYCQFIIRSCGDISNFIMDCPAHKDVFLIKNRIEDRQKSIVTCANPNDLDNSNDINELAKMIKKLDHKHIDSMLQIITFNYMIAYGEGFNDVDSNSNNKFVYAEDVEKFINGFINIKSIKSFINKHKDKLTYISKNENYSNKDIITFNMTYANLNPKKDNNSLLRNSKSVLEELLRYMVLIFIRNKFDFAKIKYLTDYIEFYPYMNHFKNTIVHHLWNNGRYDHEKSLIKCLKQNSTSLDWKFLKYYIVSSNGFEVLMRTIKNIEIHRFHKVTFYKYTSMEAPILMKEMESSTSDSSLSSYSISGSISGSISSSNSNSNSNSNSSSSSNSNSNSKSKSNSSSSSSSSSDSSTNSKNSSQYKKLNSEIKNEVKKLLPNHQDHTNLKLLHSKISNIIMKHWPGLSIHLFGSSTNGLWSHKSDVDLCIFADYDGEFQRMNKLAHILKLEKMVNVIPIEGARIPICKFMDPSTGLKCDISVNNRIATYNSKLIRCYIDLDDRVRDIIMIVKEWAKHRGINNSKNRTFSSYSFVLLCLSFFQHIEPPVLPNLQSTQKFPAHKMINKTVEISKKLLDKNNRKGKKMVRLNLQYYNDMAQLPKTFQTKNTMSRGELLLKFFEFYSQHYDYKTMVSSIRTDGGFLLKNTFKTRFAIEDPFIHDRNTTSNARVEDKEHILNEFTRAYYILRKPNSNLNEIFKSDEIINENL
jgi:DNA polymerase sigma